MAKSTRKTGLPKALEEELPNPMEPTLEEFVRDLHGDADTPQEGLPDLKWLKEQFSTTSARIRYLVNQGFAVKHIAKHLGIRYQQARNVATNPLKRGPNEDWRKPLIEGKDIPDLKHFKPETDPKP